MWTRIAQTALLAAAIDPSSLPQPQRADAYEVLTGEELEGSGFVIRHRDRLWAVTSIHQFDGKTPARMLQLQNEPDEIPLDTRGALRQRDVQAIPLRDQATPVPYLAYDADVRLASREPLVVLAPDGSTVKALLGEGPGYSCSEGPRALTATAQNPFLAEGGSGAPLVREATGSVVGVLLGADSADQARQITFEALCLSAARPAHAADTGRGFAALPASTMGAAALLLLAGVAPLLCGASVVFLLFVVVWRALRSRRPHQE